MKVEGFLALVSGLEPIKLDDPKITEDVRRQDVMTENFRILAAGIPQKLPKS